jgi:hypothetical protein
MKKSTITDFDQLLAHILNVCKKEEFSGIILAEFDIELPEINGKLIASKYCHKVSDESKTIVLDIFSCDSNKVYELISKTYCGTSTFVTNTKIQNEYLIWRFDLPLE